MAPDHRPPADAAATGLGRMAKPAGQTSRRSPWSSGRNQEAQCPACAAPVNAGDRYCEACGQELGAPVVAAPVVVAPGAVAPGALVVGAYGLDAGTGQWLSSADPSAPCPGCGSTVFSPDAFCDGCGEPACLTVDDSLAARLVAAGVDVGVVAENPQGAALVRWLGADARDTEPHLHTFAPPGPGRVLVCSDGLFRYRPVVADLAAAMPDGAPLETARALVQLALNEGGQDNVTVAVVPYPPSPGGSDR